jgi:hypothetical protein
MQTTKTRHQFYLTDALSEKLEALARKPGASKSSILSDALSAWIEWNGAAELDAKFGPRLDRLTRSLGAADGKLDTLVETLGALIEYQMNLTAHQPTFDDETRHLGRQRYNQLIEYVGRKLAKRQAPMKLDL